MCVTLKRRMHMPPVSGRYTHIHIYISSISYHSSPASELDVHGTLFNVGQGRVD